ncbi:MAG: hypothetical protein KDA75_15950 [Planctomycetaceae bacterium]|nr:hypothetical protein [Planctomycetaceae bacterium]
MSGAESSTNALPPDDDSGSVSLLLRDLRRGDSNAALILWGRYLPRLTWLAERTLAGRRTGIADAGDAVQSAWISFWRMLDTEKVPTHLNREDFWNLLGLMVVRKVRRQVRRESAVKRGSGQVVRETDLPADGGTRGMDDWAAGLSTADFDLHSEELLALLDEECRRIAVLRLLGHLNREIAEELMCTERKVQRKLELIRMRWSCWLD